MEEMAQKLADAKDLYAAMEFLASQEDIVTALKTLNTLQRKSYWDRKDIGRCMGFGRAGVQLGLTKGRHVAGSNPDLSISLIGHAKAISYNFASFS